MVSSRCVFTDTGLGILEANRDQQVVTTINVFMDLQDPIDGVVPAQASLVPNEAWWDANCPSCTYDPETPGTTPPTTALIGIDSNIVESKYGDLVITKTDAQGGALLVGAEFTVYADGDNNELCDDTDLVLANQLKAAVATDALRRRYHRRPADLRLLQRRHPDRPAHLLPGRDQGPGRLQPARRPDQVHDHAGVRHHHPARCR